MDIKKYYISFCAYNISYFNNVGMENPLPILFQKPVKEGNSGPAPVVHEEEEVEKKDNAPAPTPLDTDVIKKVDEKLCNCGSVQKPDPTPTPIKNEKKIKNEEITNIPDRIGIIGHDIRKTIEFINKLSEEDKKKYFEKVHYQLYQYSELTEEYMKSCNNDCKKLYDEVLNLNEQFKEKINQFFLKKIKTTKFDKLIENLKYNSFGLEQIKKTLSYSYSNYHYKDIQTTQLADAPSYWINSFVYNCIIENPLITLLWLSEVFDAKNFLKNQKREEVFDRDENKRFESIFITFLDHCSKDEKFFGKIKEILANTDEYSNIHYLLMCAISGFTNVKYKYENFEYKNIIKDIFKALNSKKSKELKDKFFEKEGIIFDSGEFEGKLSNDLDGLKNDVKKIHNAIITGDIK